MERLNQKAYRMKLRLSQRWVKYIPVVLIALAIGLSPSFSIGEISTGRDLEIRLEDLLIVVLGIVWIAGLLRLRKTRLERPPLLIPILVWLGIGFFSLLTNWLFQNLIFQRSFFFFLKEVEFFAFYFYVFYHIKNIDVVRILIKTWILIGVIHASWILFQVITGLRITYYYGSTLFIEPEGTFPGGGFLLILFAFLLQFLLYYYVRMNLSVWQKIAIAAAVVMPTVGIFSSGSRTAFFGFLFALVITFFLYLAKQSNFRKAVLQSVWVLLIIGIAFGFLVMTSPTVERRLLQLEGITKEFNPQNPNVRGDTWKTQLTGAFERPLFLLFGFGKSIIFTFGESHNQYVRNFIETGIVGSLIFLMLIFVVISKAWKEFLKGTDPLILALSAGVLVITSTMLFMSIVVDAFIVVKIAELYWFFIALSMTTFYLTKKKINSYHE